MFEIRHWTGKVLFSFETDNIKVALQAAVHAGADLYGANLRDANLRDADLYGANLYGANLYGADLYGANLRAANLRDANLRAANLRDANLRAANLRAANLRAANLRDANLRAANLRDANLRDANLRDANLRDANLYGADLYGADLGAGSGLPPYQLVPDEGSFIAWKKLRDGIVAKLLIPEHAQRVSTPVGRKCRTNEAEVLAMFDRNGNALPEGTEAKSKHDPSFAYRAGQAVTEPNYDGDFRKECTSGIHFFITRKEAEDY